MGRQPLATEKANIARLIGNTPMVDLSHLAAVSSVTLLAKLEQHNPSGSIKDRVALMMIDTAERQGLLSPGDTILEPTSGNTGLGLAMIGSTRGYKVKAVMPGSVSSERVALLQALGVDIVFSDPTKGTNESILVAHNMASEDSSLFMPYQYGNTANPEAHFRTTGAEIVAAIPKVSAFVAGLGTGGTLMGVGRALRARDPEVKVIATAPHPDDVVQGLRAIEDGFIPPILDLDFLDGRILIEAEEAFYWTKKLLATAGLFVGVSSGATFAASLKVAHRLSREEGGGVIVTIFADGGWKYLSSQIYSKDFNDIKDEIEGKIWW